MNALMITQPVGAYAVGETVSDKDAMKALLASNPNCVVKVKLAEAPEAKKASEPKSGATGG